MGLSDFIAANAERVLGECKAFTRTLLPAAAGLDSTALRDHVAQILSTENRNLFLGVLSHELRTPLGTSVAHDAVVLSESPELNSTPVCGKCCIAAWTRPQRRPIEASSGSPRPCATAVPVFASA